MLVKKYGNRRLYDTDSSGYITLEELADRIRAGADVRVVDAKTGEDLTRQTLGQIIVESRGATKLLPVPLLTQLVRLGDDAFAEFFGRWVTWALEVYLQMRTAVREPAGWNPFGQLPWGGAQGFPYTGFPSWGAPQQPAAPPQPAAPAPPAAAAAPAPGDDVASLRREIEELRRAVRKSKR